ncbi:MAG TPA: RdgB/HAM1 family non-canonical purine NTP pyrophosphatase [Saprospiraceae bacterium]|nr:RdgB/HAM1 family non-canonical purine NTP pyrophosphatase [Saprospiraceae bacterium]
MGKDILFATHNDHKAKEVRELLPAGFSLLTLSDINWTLEIPEPFETYEENAKAKAYFIFDRTGIPCFADDSGLAIDALQGKPGVHSARYAGPGRNTQDNIDKVLRQLSGEMNRRASFYAVIAYVTVKEIQLFRGNVEGKITTTPIGNSGFGYDPIFIPDGFDQTFGQMNEKLKNMISHRAKAMEKFVSYLGLLTS